MLHKTPLFRFKRGDHICIFYRNESDLLDTLVPYVLDGLHSNEQVFCVQTTAVAEQLEVALNSAGVNVANEKKRGAFEMHTEAEAYFPHGQFEPNKMIAMLERTIAKAGEQGFSGFRSAGELRWASTGICTCDQVVEYEQMVQAVFPHRPAIGLCQYPMSTFDPAVLNNVFEAHRMALTHTMAESHHSSLYVRHGQFTADIVADRRDPSSRYYFVVQPHGDREIVSWGVEDNFERATRASERVIAQMDKYHTRFDNPRN
jgi:MEDS: MEthanogen/methylotroph, DcmR Sensory domain